MPQLRLLSLLRDRKALELTNLVFQLDDETDFCWGAEIPHNQERDDLQEAVSRQEVFVLSDLWQLLKSHRGYLHDVADVQILNPFSLVEESKNVPEVDRLLRLDVFFLASSLARLTLLGFLLWVKAREANPNLRVVVRRVELFVLPSFTVLLSLRYFPFNHLNLREDLLVDRQQLFGGLLCQRYRVFKVVVNALFCLVLAHRDIRDSVLVL